MDRIIHKAQAFAAKRILWTQCPLFYTAPRTDLMKARYFWNETKTNFRTAVHQAHLSLLHVRDCLKTYSKLAIWIRLHRLRRACQHRLGKSYQDNWYSCPQEDTRITATSSWENEVDK